MVIEFRTRNYRAEEEACSLSRVRADVHPLSITSPSRSATLHSQVGVHSHGSSNFWDPLGVSSTQAVGSVEDLRNEESDFTNRHSDAIAVEFSSMEWSSFRRILVQKFPVSKTISVSSMSPVFMKSGKVKGKSITSLHLEELDDQQKFSEEDVKVISQQEYMSQLYELKAEINRAWTAGDRVTSLKFSIKVARLLMDTSVMQFYPALFVVATDIMDMLGDMVWERIRHKAEFAEDGALICPLRENFDANSICFDAKETCYNWFCKIGSIRDLLPRIYLELAILPCSRFLLDKPMDSLKRLVTMTRGIADPLASAYCRLYMVYRAQKLPQCDQGYLLSSINDLKVLLMSITSAKEIVHGNPSRNQGFLFSLIDPAIEYMVKSIFKDSYQTNVSGILVELELGTNLDELFGEFPCISILVHHILKELPSEVVIPNALEILRLVECSNDGSFDQCLNYRLLGFRLCEEISHVNMADAVMDKVVQVICNYRSLDDYLKVVDAFVDIVLQNGMDIHLNAILDGIFERAFTKEITEIEVGSLQSVLLKLVVHADNIKDIFSLNHFIETLDLMHGGSRNTIDIQILKVATRNDHISEPTTIQFLFEASQALHDGIDFSNNRNNYIKESARLISRFVQMVDYGSELEHHLSFLNECRGAFPCMDEIKETLVHASNSLAIKAMKGRKDHLAFIKSCLAFSEITIPSVPAHFKQLNLYLETAEIALFGGLVSHSDGLIDSAISCLQNLDFLNGLQIPDEVDRVVSLIQKFCSLTVMVPGNPIQGVTYIPKCILSFVNSQSWMTRKKRVRVLCAIISLLATLSQHKLPYHGTHEEVIKIDNLFFGDLTFLQELVLLADLSLHDIVDIILNESSQSECGNMALEACNCLALSFRMTPEILPICSKLVETAELCLSAADDKYLKSTMKFLDR